MNKYDIIISPILTEKSYDGIAEKKYTFKVASDATKTQIKVAVEDIFGVKVAKVNTVNVNGKKKRMGRSEGMTSAYKKAVVTLTEDSKTIEFFESLA
ncbi:MAG: 50S ribosomal protein L23 [Clostridia bacterium]|nr:50S ribosomal protein L23 [Clostridia bacterium]MDE7192008.1 50S ribosomal protein L23 [Clostridia bacterium]MDE7349194.1 50S ribosomal protein L23 [Clostridia bacterium]